jgi:aerobic C4-dicarboxylate transport protein
MIKRIFHHFYAWVVLAIFIGAAIGYLAPNVGESLKPLGEGFIALVKMLIAPIIFCTVVTGIAGAGDMKKVGRIGLKAIVYFEVISTLALAIGLIVANVLTPGAGFNATVESLDPNATSQFTQSAAHSSTSEFIMHIIPKSFVDAFTSSGDLLQVLLLAILFGWALNRIGEKGQPVLKIVHSFSAVLFSMINAIMKLAPVGAGGAMAFTIGKYGAKSLLPLASLMGCFYLTCILFVLVVLGSVAAMVGFNIFKFLRYIREELFLVLGTSSSESALVPLMEKLERLGSPKATVGLVVPAGYSFNLDGTNIYMTLSALFIAQAFNVPLTLGQQLSILAVAALTSKGASGVTGAGFITLAATLAVVPQVPIAGMALILGVDRFMSEARALTNIIGNGVATLVVSRWENELDLNQVRREFSRNAELGLGDPKLQS